MPRNMLIHDPLAAMAQSRRAHLAATPRHYQCEDCGFDLHSGLTPDDLPERRCPKCAASWWAMVPPRAPAIAGDVLPVGTEYARKVRVPDPLPIQRTARPLSPRRIDEHELAVARRKAI